MISRGIKKGKSKEAQFHGKAKDALKSDMKATVPSLNGIKLTTNPFI